MTFEEALEEVFEERASSLSAEGKRLLRDLFEQGVLLGREQERTEMAKHLPIAKLAETVPENPWVQAVHALFRKGVVLLPGDNGEAIVSTQEWEREYQGTWSDWPEPSTEGSIFSKNEIPPDWTASRSED